jgi:hypothetical protein
MARIFDNIDQDLLGALRATLQVSKRSDFCVGYLNLRGWQAIDDLIAPRDPAKGQISRVLVGRQRRVMKFRHDSLTVQCLLPKKSSTEIQCVDAIVEKAFHPSPIEADYFASYYIKYRLGQGAESRND